MHELKDIFLELTRQSLLFLLKSRASSLWFQIAISLAANEAECFSYVYYLFKFILMKKSIHFLFKFLVFEKFICESSVHITSTLPSLPSNSSSDPPLPLRFMTSIIIIVACMYRHTQKNLLSSSSVVHVLHMLFTTDHLRWDNLSIRRIIPGGENTDLPVMVATDCL